MNRTQRAKIRAAREALDTAREFKNDAIYTATLNAGGWNNSRQRDRMHDEVAIFKGNLKNIRKMKKYNGTTGMMSESDYLELMGA